MSTNMVGPTALDRRLTGQCVETASTSTDRLDPRTRRVWSTMTNSWYCCAVVYSTVLEIGNVARPSRSAILNLPLQLPSHLREPGDAILIDCDQS